MIKRIITAVVALAVFIGVLLLPPICFTVALGAVILFMLYECYSATKTDFTTGLLGFFSAFVYMASIYIMKMYPSYHLAEVLVIVGIFIVIALNMAMVVAKHGKRNYKDILSNAFLTMYVVLSMGCIWVAKKSFGTIGMLLPFICAWSCDTFAYFTGRFLGKHKLIPHVSPNKTVEGSIGGIVGAMVICFLYFVILKNAMTIVGTQWDNLLLQGIVYGAIGGALSQLGDLVASAIKRDTGIKDFGSIFPGHGGFVDRFDSVMYIAPIMLGLMCFTGLI